MTLNELIYCLETLKRNGEDGNKDLGLRLSNIGSLSVYYDEWLPDTIIDKKNAKTYFVINTNGEVN